MKPNVMFEKRLFSRRERELKAKSEAQLKHGKLREMMFFELTAEKERMLAEGKSIGDLRREREFENVQREAALSREAAESGNLEMLVKDRAAIAEAERMRRELGMEEAARKALPIIMVMNRRRASDLLGKWALKALAAKGFGTNAMRNAVGKAVTDARLKNPEFAVNVAASFAVVKSGAAKRLTTAVKNRFGALPKAA